MLNTSYPAPQADRLDKVAVVVDAAAAGCTTAEAIAASLDLVPRQGSYYANAAGYLGLLELKGDSEISEWEITAAGQAFLALTPEERIIALHEIVSQAAPVQAYLEGGEEAVEVLLGASGLSGQTIDRRLHTVISWTEAVTSPETAVPAIRTEQDGARIRAVAAALAQAERIREVREMAKAKERPVSFCGTCFLQMPAAGDCQYC
jgi:hypothetical protein